MTIARDPSGRPDVGAVLPELQAALRAEKSDDPLQLSVPREVRVEAEQQLVEKARQLAFTAHRPFLDALDEVIKRSPALFKLARAAVDLPQFASIKVKP